MERVTVLVDKQEKKPLLFPERLECWTAARVWGRQKAPIQVCISVEKRTLRCGDYTLEGCEELVAVERKGSLQEIVGNVLSPDRARFVRALSRFTAEVKYPYLFIEELPMAFWQDPRANENMIKSLDVVLELVARSRLSLIWGGRRASDASARRRLGEIILRILIQHWLVVRGETPLETPPEPPDGGR